MDTQNASKAPSIERQDQNAFAKLVALEMGTLTGNLQLEVDLSADVLDFYADNAAILRNRISEEITTLKSRNDQTISRTRGEDAGCVHRASLTFEVLLQGKWRIQILCALRSGPVRLGQLARLIPGASKKMLTQHLRKLEADGIVMRTDLSDFVLHIEYAVTSDLRESVFHLLDELCGWGDLYAGWSATSSTVLLP